MTCDQVREIIDLYAAGGCDTETSESIKTHIKVCASCAESHKHALQVIAFTDCHYKQSQKIKNIITSIDRQHSKSKPWLFIPAAAVLLLAILMYIILSPKPINQDEITKKTDKQNISMQPWDKKTLSDGTILYASSDAKFKEIDARTLELNSGELCVLVAKSDKPFQITTPPAVATARGTSFYIKILQPAIWRGEESNMKPLKLAVTVLVLSGLVQLQNSYGNLSGTHGESLYAQEDSAPKKQVEDLALRFAKYYEPVKIKVDPKIPSYNLPLDTKKVANFDDVVEGLGLDKEAVEKLKKNGFVVLPGHYANEDIVKPYKDMKKRGIPIFITSDTLLHLYHVQFDETLKDIEEREFYKDIVALVETMVDKLQKDETAVDNNDFKEAKNKALTYFTIALKSLNPDAKIPDSVEKKDVEEVLENMKKHDGFWPDPTSASVKWPLFRYAEDFSQYVPRGHYTRSEILKKYFVGMMWLGRMTFILKGGEPYGPFDEPFLVSSKESNQQTLTSALITKLLDESVLADKRKVKDVWERIYSVTSFYVGLADDLGPQEYKDALFKVCGNAMKLAVLSDEKKLHEYKVELAKHNPPAIYSGTGGQGTFKDIGPDKLLEALHKSMGFRFMGQRFIPDSHMMGTMVFPTVGGYCGGKELPFTAVVADGGIIRGFPRGLDVMTLLGSKRAREITKELGDDAYKGGGKVLSYDEGLEKLKKDYENLTEKDWNRNLYWSWLYALKPLLEEHGKGYQTFMTTEAWKTKSLTTALASWAQLRHDTILYAKQSYTMDLKSAGPRPVQGYVEPIPDFFARLLTLSRMTSKGLTEMKVLDDEAKKRLDEFEKLIERLLLIVEKELANKELKEDDYKFICNIADELQKASVAPNKEKLAALEKELADAKAKGEHDRVVLLLFKIDIEKNGAMETTLVADVHTDQNTQKCLEEGTGPVGLLVACYIQPDGRLVLGAGPVLSYYEFKHPMSDRLTDEKWRELLKDGKASEEPSWTKPYTSKSTTYTCKEEK